MFRLKCRFKWGGAAPPVRGAGIDTRPLTGLNFHYMKTTLAVATLPLIFLSMAPAIATPGTETPQRRVEKANVLPLALDDRYQFRKVQEFLNEPKFSKPTVDQMIVFERQRVNYGAVTSLDRLEVRGHYYNFYWRAKPPGPLKVRFEYRQANLGSYVQAREVDYDTHKGTMETKFQVIGDDYLQDGRVIAWRALLIADGKIVGLTQSYLWD